MLSFLTLSVLQYEGGEQCKSCGHVLHTAQIPVEQIRAMPSEILPSFLYLGSYDHASRMELLRAMGITHVLSVRLSKRDPQTGIITICKMW